MLRIQKLHVHTFYTFLSSLFIQDFRMCQNVEFGMLGHVLFNFLRMRSISNEDPVVIYRRPPLSGS